MFVFYNRTRKALTLLFLASLVSCQLFDEEKVEAKRDLWFENNTNQLDQLFIVPHKGLSDSLSFWLQSEERILNHLSLIHI